PPRAPRVQPPSHTRRTTAGPRRRSAARASSKGASRRSPHSRGGARRAGASLRRAARAARRAPNPPAVRPSLPSEVSLDDASDGSAAADGRCTNLEISLRRARAYALSGMTIWWRRSVAAGASLAAVALVTGAIYALKPVAPVLSLGVLYLFAVLPVAALWGLPFATAVSVVSMLAFNWFFRPPRHTFRLADSENWVALAVYLVTAVSVSGLAARARRRAAEAEQQQREAAFAAEVSAILFERP